MVIADIRRCGGPGLHAPARLLSAACAVLILGTSHAAAAQTGAQTRSPVQAAPAVPDPLVLSKLLWSTMAAIDHANKTGNYTVLHALGSPAFRTNNNPTTLANVFAGIRASRIDLADTFLLEPRLEFPPSIQAGLLRMRGAFRMRPTGVQFDLLYQWDNGWKLDGVAIQPVSTVPAIR
jgi:hypothetical protein